MVFGQLTASDSMRDLMLSLEAHQQKYYHLGFGSSISHRNFGTANERCNYKISEEFAYVLNEEARRRCYRDDFEIKKEILTKCDCNNVKELQNKQLIIGWF